MKNENFSKEQNLKLTLKLRELINQLPVFCENFFRGIEPITSIKTRIAYAFDLRTFFYFITQELDDFYGREIKELSLEEIDRISSVEIEKFLEFLSFYSLPHYKNNDEYVSYSNSNSGKSRKLASLRSFYKYYFKKEMIDNNPSILVDMPKIKEKAIIRLEVDEIAKLLDTIEEGENLTKSQKKYHTYNRERDLALISLLLGTGIRISECVGLNKNHFNFENNSFVVTRKGGSQSILYFSEEVKNTLLNYIEVRNKITPHPGHEDAYFLSLQKKRLSVSSIQKLVKKYSKIITPLKNISPHKLRSTYGTNLYRETGDIYLVADVLGHKDVNTTKKHYAAISDEQRRKAAKAVKLRED
ncbi:MAG: tyrosine-type recombinase/integrase [Eubacteriaceae bacterium]